MGQVVVVRQVGFHVVISADCTMDYLYGVRETTTHPSTRAETATVNFSAETVFAEPVGDDRVPKVRSDSS